MYLHVQFCFYGSLISTFFCGKLLAADYCPWENFSPQCSSTDEMVLIQSATYGMMQKGRCVEEDFGYLGCSTDQLWYLDQQCSGRRSCEITLGSNKDLKDRLTSCPVPYLEADFTCLKVLSPTSGQCHSAYSVDVKSNPGHLASITSAQTSCGYGNSPWLLSAQPGQTINLTLVDFSWDEHYTAVGAGGSRDCARVYGLILSYTSDEVVQICGGQSRTQQLKHSPSHQIQIVLEESAVTGYHFVIKYEALGCPDAVPPKNGWVRKDGSDVRVGCHASSDTWQLKCVGSNWIGITGNCSAVIVSTSPEVQPIEKENFNNFHVFAVAVGCLAIIVCCVTVTLGVYCIKRYQVKAEFSHARANTSTLYLAPKSTNRLQNTTVHPGTTSRGPHLTHGCFEDTLLPDVTNAETLLSRGQRGAPVNGGTVGRITGSDVNAHAQVLPKNSVNQEQAYNGSSHVSGEDSVKFYVLENPPGYNSNNT